MAEPKVAVVAKKTRKREGYRRVMVTLTEAQAKQLDDLAVADDRQGGATEILTVLCKRNFDGLVKTLKPAVLDFHSGLDFKPGQRDVEQEIREANQKEAEAVR